MKTGVKLACLVAFLAAGLGFWSYARSVTAQNIAPGTAMAVCDIHRAYQAYKRVVDLKAKLTDDRDRIQAEVTDLNRQAKNMQDELAASGFLSGSPEFEQKRREILKKSLETKNFADLSQNELRRQDMRIVETSYQDVYKAVEKIAAKTTGFIYTVSLMGTTGERTGLSDQVKPLIARLKEHTDKPIYVGFGISTPQHALQVAQAGADGVIIGSRIIKFIEENLNSPPAMKKQIKAFIEDVIRTLKS